MVACLPLVVKWGNNNLSARCKGLYSMGAYLLQEGELLGYVLCAVFILAEGEPLLTVLAGVGEVIHHGAVAGHRQGRGDGEGLLFRQGCRGLHYSWESPLRIWERDLTREDTCSESWKQTDNTVIDGAMLFYISCRVLLFNGSETVESINGIYIWNTVYLSPESGCNRSSQNKNLIDFLCLLSQYQPVSRHFLLPICILALLSFQTPPLPSDLQLPLLPITWLSHPPRHLFPLPSLSPVQPRHLLACYPPVGLSVPCTFCRGKFDFVCLPDSYLFVTLSNDKLFLSICLASGLCFWVKTCMWRYICPD